MEIKKMSKVNGAIVTTTTNNNYGNVAQRYALQKFLQKHGYNFVSYYFYGFYWRIFFVRLSVFTYVPRNIVAKVFRQNPQGSSGVYNYHKLSVFCRERINQKLFLPFFNKKYSTYIIGSDQNLGTPIKEEFFTSWQNFLLKFVTWDAKRISYASSFGKGSLGKEVEFIKSDTAKELMQKFDAVSIREQSGVELAQDIWGVQARQVVDPALLLEKSDYDSLIDNPTAELQATKPVFYYLLRVKKDSDLYMFTQKVADDLNLEVDGCLTYDNNKLMHMEQWLQGFRDSQFVVTNSFHGVVFSLINNTDFVVLCRRKDENGAVRFQDILGKLGLSDRIIFDDQFDDFDVSSMQKIDWKDVNEKVGDLRKDSAEWLLEQVAKKK
jgi:polysaccharide pyruvyl transferase WcaK-like protein